MKPIGPLMREHRLIERMVAVLSKEITKLENRGEPDLHLLMTAVDFFRIYADRTRHGKEEDILLKTSVKSRCRCNISS